MAHFDYISTSIIELMDMDEEKKDDVTDNNYYNDDDGGEIYDGGEQTYDDVGKTNDNGEQTYNNIEDTNIVYESTYCNRSMAGHSVNDNRWNSVDALSSASTTILDEEEQEFGYSKFCLEANEVFEGTMCRITGPTSFMLVITKVGGADLSVTKDRMYNEMYNKCGTLPPLDPIVPGMKHVLRPGRTRRAFLLFGRII